MSRSSAFNCITAHTMIRYIYTRNGSAGMLGPADAKHRIQMTQHFPEDATQELLCPGEQASFTLGRAHFTGGGRCCDPFDGSRRPLQWLYCAYDKESYQSRFGKGMTPPQYRLRQASRL